MFRPQDKFARSATYPWQGTTIDKDLTTPPGSPSEGDRYIVGPSATGDWSGHDDEIAEYFEAAWQFCAPAAGWRVDILDESKQYRYSGSAWILVGEGGGGGFPSPDYDSGWFAISQGASVGKTHNLGGDADDYFVDITAKDTSEVGINNKYFGVDVDRSNERGYYYTMLDTTSINIRRAVDDFNADYLRVRIWVY